MAQTTAIERITAASPPEAIAEYHAFVDASPQGIMYCKTWWLEALVPGRWEVLLLRSGPAIRAAWPLVYAADGQNIGMPPLTQKLGVLYAPSEARYTKRLGDEIVACDELIAAVPEHVAVQQRFHEAFTNWLPFMWRGFEQQTLYTYVFDDLESVGDYMSRMANDCRQRIRAAQKELRVRESEDLKLMYDVNCLTFDRQNEKCPFSLATVERLHNACRANAGSRILIAEDPQGNIHASDYMVYDPRVAVSIIQGADPRFRKGGAQRLLDWDSINFAATVSKRFDFEGSVMQGVEPYNRGFGAKQMPYFSISREANASRGHKRNRGTLKSTIAKALRSAAARIDRL
jgi:hypothetical protein